MLRVQHNYAILILPLMLCLASQAQAAEGNRIIGAGVNQQAATGAGAASGHDAFWIVLNPACLTAVETRADVSLQVLLATATFDGQGAFANTSGELEADEVVPAPQLAYHRRIDEQRSLAFGIHTITGTQVNLPEGRSAPGAAFGFDDDIKYGALRASSAYAHKFGEWSVGFAANLNYAQLSTNMITGAGTETKGANETDTALGAGFMIGVQYAAENWSAGLAYTSRQWFESFDKYDDLLSGPLDQPQTIQLGLAWQADEQWELLLDYRFIDYDSVTVIDEGFLWNDLHTVKLAARYAVSDSTTVIAGVSYGEAQIGPDGAFVNALSQLVNEWHLGLGFEHRREQWEFGFAVVHSPENTVTDDGTGPLGALAQGSEVGLSVTSLIASVGYRF